MKKCSVCGQIYSDDNVFCVDDGTTLNSVSDAASNRVVIPVGDDRPTQVITRPPPERPVQPAPASNGLYIVIGVLIAVILMGAGYLFLQNRGATDTANNRKNENSSSSNQNTANVSTQTNFNAQKPDNAANTNAERAKTVPDPDFNRANTSVSRSFNQAYEGTVNYDPIEMQLVRNGTSLSGKVIPRNRYADISVRGTIGDDGSFEMTEYSDLGAITGMYRGRIQADNTITGSWSKPDGSKSRPLYLKAK
jgi:Tfp pilus assembly protein PilV